MMDAVERSPARRGLVVTIPDGGSVHVVRVSGPDVGAQVSCPGEHPTRTGERCGRVLTHIAAAGGIRQTIRCWRCDAYVRIEGDR